MPQRRLSREEFDRLEKAGSALPPPSAKPTAKPGFFEGIRENLIPTWEELKFLSHALADRPDMPSEAREQLILGLWEQMKGQGRQAKEEFKAGRYGGAAAHALGTFPVIGPPMAEAAHRIGTAIEPFGEEEGELSRGLGNVVGLVAPLVGPKLPGAVRGLRGVQSPPIPPPRLPLTAAERGGSTVVELLEQVSERTPPGAAVYRPFRKAQQRILIDEVAGDVVERISKFEGSSETVGYRVQEALKEGRNVARNKATEAYEAIAVEVESTVERVRGTRPVEASIVGPKGEPITLQRPTYTKVKVGGARPETAPLKKFAIHLLRELDEQKHLFDPADLKGMQAQLRNITRAPKNLDFRTFKDARTSLMEVTRQLDLPMRGKRAGISAKLTGIVDEAMMKALRDAGREDLIPLLRDADAIWKEVATDFNKTALKKMVETNAVETIPAMLHKINLSEIRAVRSYLGPAKWAEMKAQFTQDIIDTAVRGELGPKFFPEQITGALGYEPVGFPHLRATTLQNSLEKLSKNGRLETIYSKAEIKNMLNVVSYAERVGVKPSILASIVGASASLTILYGTAGGLVELFTTGSFTGLVNPAALSAGIYGMSKLMTSQGGSRILTGLAKAVSAKNVGQIVFWANRATDAIKKAGGTTEETALQGLLARGPRPPSAFRTLAPSHDIPPPPQVPPSQVPPSLAPPPPALPSNFPSNLPSEIGE